MTQQHTTPASQRVFLTGATGSIGIAATRALLAAGHEVVGVTRSPEGTRALLDLRATPVEVDLFDLEAVREAVAGCGIVVHFATSIPTGEAAAKPKSWAMNDRLRTEGTSNLIEAAESTGVHRFIFESISLAYPDDGTDWIDESTPLDPPAPMMQTAVQSETMLASYAERGGEAVSLRFGRLYGPGRASDSLIEAMQARQMPIIGNGKNYVSSIHADDAGSATAAAIDVRAGTYNIVDDEPMTQSDLMNMIRSTLDAPAPKRIPYLAARLAVGKAARVMSVSQRVSNRRFREAAGWAPRYASATAGWATMSTSSPDRAATPA